MARRAQHGESGTHDVVTWLVEAGRIDTAYRDLYLERARRALLDRLPPAEYARLKEMQQEIERAIRQARAAVLQSDWLRVKQLTAHLTNVRRVVESRHADLQVAEAVYGSQPVSLDPFSPGLETLRNRGGQSAEIVRDRLLQTLSSLQEGDPGWAGFYARRGAHFASLVLMNQVGGPVAHQLDPQESQREALRAAEQGEFDRLAALADAMLNAEAREEALVQPVQAIMATSQRSSHLAEPLPLDIVRRARPFGLAATTLRSYERIAAFVSRHAWQGAVTNGYHGADESAPVPNATIRPGVPKRLQEILRQFIAHPYVNSSGVRYLPRLTMENLLVEYFPESPDPPAESPLLAAVGLSRRRGLARSEIEAALLERGPHILEHELGLDPRDYRMICIPPDVYTRLGQYCGWGRQRLWTHFDGYQLLRDSRTLALVGGDVRYGGVFDLCSISPDDQRDGVIARFAVVRRERLLGSWR